MRAAGALFLAVLAAAAAGCGSGSGGGGSRLTVFAAASLAEILPALDPRADFSFGGSDELAAQIRIGAPADVYVSASSRYPRELYADGLVEEPRVFSTNRLVVIVPRTNPAGIRSVDDLRRRGVRLVLGAEGVPVGDYAREALAALGAEEALANVVSEESDVKSVVGKIVLAAADAGIVYATDAAPLADEVETVEIPASAQPRIEYLVAVVQGTERRAGAEAFVELLLGDEGRAALREAGFGLP